MIEKSLMHKNQLNIFDKKSYFNTFQGNGKLNCWFRTEFDNYLVSEYFKSHQPIFINYRYGLLPQVTPVVTEKCVDRNLGSSI